MERHISKRRRVHPIQPNTLERNEFARKYVNYLVPALMVVNKKDMSSSEKDRNQPLEKVVNMALALAASGFAWGCALKRKLQESACHVQGNKTVGADDELAHDQERKPVIDEKQLQGEEEEENDYDDDEDEDDDDEKIIGKKLERLRSILPGGDGIESIHALLGELGCYITCLQSQVNVLRRLSDQQQH